ncbi:MAG: 8-oxoguanine deaminase, partial [Kiritimatiellia bacterium]
MAKILLKNVNTLVTMVPGEKPLHNVDLLISGKKIEAIGPNLEIPAGAKVRTIDGTNRVVYPGLVNTHHHLYQTLTRNLPKVQNAKLFDWLIG